MTATVLCAGLLLGAGVCAAILWSIFRPGRRLWPPSRFTARTPWIVWGLTGLFFGAVVWTGLAGWGELALPGWLRFGLGAPLVGLANLVVWREALALGLDQTAGDTGGLRTDGLYQYSRNPQYLADMAMLIGWGLWSASVLTWPLVAVGVLALGLAPLAEEPWLRARHGAAYDAYCARVRRFF